MKQRTKKVLFNENAKATFRSQGVKTKIFIVFQLHQLLIPGMYVSAPVHLYRFQEREVENFNPTAIVSNLASNIAFLVWIFSVNAD